jgi:integrase
VGGKTVEKVAGPRKQDADYLLGKVERLMGRNHLTLEEAIAEEFGERPAGCMVFSEALDLYIQACERQRLKKDKTLRADVYRAAILKAAPWADKPLGSFSRRDVREWVARRMADGVKGGTIQNDLSLASACWRWCDDEELVGPDHDNPFLRARLRRVTRRERIALEPEELQALLGAAKEDAPFYTLLLAAVFTGWRGGELEDLSESDLHLDDPAGACITLRPRNEKGGKAKCGFIGEPLVSILRAEREGPIKRHPQAALLRTGRGQRWATKARNAALREALGRVSITKIAEWKRTGDEDYIGLDFHSLRHSVRTLLSARGHRDQAVGELLGQSARETQARYNHAYASEASAIAADVETFLSDRVTRKVTGTDNVIPQADVN